MSTKHINWPIEEFTSIDLTMPTEKGSCRKSKKFVTLEEEDKKIRFLSSETDYDEQGRPKHVINYNEEKEIESEIEFYYEPNKERAILFEDGDPASEWVFKFTPQGQILSREFIDLGDQSKEMEIFRYDAQQRLVEYRQETYENGARVDDATVVSKLEWDGERVKEIVEFYEEEVDSNILFEYNELGQVTSVKTFLQTEEGEELVEEQKPVFDAQGNVVENTTIFHESGAKVIYRYEYDAENNLLKTTFLSFEEDDLIQESISTNNAQGQVERRVERYLVSGTVETEEYEFDFSA
jgi:hypothetical protein